QIIENTIYTISIPYLLPVLGNSIINPLFFFNFSGPLRNLHSFPTRRSSDLLWRLRLSLWRGLLQYLDDGLSGDSHRPVLQRPDRSEEHTSELQSRFDLVCRLLLEKNNSTHNNNHTRIIFTTDISNIIYIRSN